MNAIVCVASGPSLTPADADYCRGKARVLVINDNYRLAPWADWLYAADAHWWNKYASDVKANFTGECWTCTEAAAKAHGLKYIASAKRPGLSRDPYVIHEGHNSGYQAINLARHFGAERIVLLGYDMQGTHWFGNHPPEFKPRNDFGLFLPQFDSLAADLVADGVEVINCTRETALKVFPRSTIEQVLK